MLITLARQLSSQASAIEEWYRYKQSLGASCFYSSVDLRYMGAKLVPVDTNLFPAGFNNLNQASIASAALLAKEYLSLHFPHCKNILIIGEDHTRNLYYLDNLKSLESIVTKAGYSCRISSLSAEELIKYNGAVLNDIDVHPLVREGSILRCADGFCPDLILLNNDLMSGMPERLLQLDQAIIPKPDNGWFKRRKSLHFEIYNKLMMEIEERFSISSFALTTDFSVCNDVDFHSKSGLENLAEKVELLLQNLKIKYLHHHIKQEPYVVIKSDYGTYGMGVMIARSAEELLSINKKSRKQMHVTKNNVVNNSVIIQEGVTTIDRVEGAAAEPLLYLVNHQLASFLYRFHLEKDEYANLNSVGMRFASHSADFNEYTQACIFVARMATLAASLELC